MLGLESFRLGFFVGGLGPDGLSWRNFVGVSGTERLGSRDMTQGLAARGDYPRDL